MHDVLVRARGIRAALLGSYDFVAWLVGFAVMGVWQRLVGYGTSADAVDAALMGAVVALAFIVLGSRVHLHQGRSPIGSFPDAVLTGLLWAVVGWLGLVTNLMLGSPVRVSVTVTGPLVALVLMVGGRAAYRMTREWAEVQAMGHRTERRPVVVIGAGRAAAQLVADMQRDPTCEWRPVALVDDDPHKRRRRLSGVSVVAGAREFPAVAAQYGARTAIVAIPSLDSDQLRELNSLANAARLELKVLPSVTDLDNPAQVQIKDVRDIDVTDFLGRQPIETDVASIADYLTGKRVLVTGAGGSIGSELCRQIAKFDPAELIMLDRDESALHAVQLSIYGKAMLDSDDVVLGDIRDNLFIDALFEERRPHVVFHAAALKHLPMLEQYPGEAVKTNVWGTLSILEAAKVHRVERFVNISTDKAANPTSVLGYSKRLAEGLTAAVAKEADGTFLSVRFGNVLGSRGSVLTAFAAQIAKGGPVTVTDPGVTRYFMTVQEAVQLVIQAAAIGRDGEALVLDMGEPVSIDGVARQLIELSGKDIDVVYTGLREGEKMHEELWGDGEPDLRPAHPLVSHTPVPAFAPLEARELDPWAAKSSVMYAFQQSVAKLSPSVGVPKPRTAVALVEARVPVQSHARAVRLQVNAEMAR
jgi:FlaA1/EpsC-like NDP-sugar epimerase